MPEFVWGGRKSEEVAEDLNKIANEVLKMEPIEAPILAPKQEKFLIHRSAILTYKSCPYKAWLEYWFAGHGISPSAMSQPLLIGICVHRGLQHLLEHCRIEHPNGDFSERCITDAVTWSHKVYSEILSKKEIELKRKWVNGGWEVEDLNYTVKEIRNLIEALIRGFAAFRLRSFLEEYEVLEVEKEEVFDSFSDIVTWLGKSDGLLRRKRDNELIILSFKTASEFSNSTMFNILIDMQGCSEIVAVEERLNRIYGDFDKSTVARNEVYFTVEAIEKGITKIADGDYINLTDGLIDYFADLKKKGVKRIQVFANQYEYLIKGKHRADSSEPTKYKYQTHLLHPIKSDSAAVMQLGSGLRFGTQGDSDYEWVIPTGKLPKGKRKIDIAGDIGVKNWIEKLVRLEVQPEKGNPFQDVFLGGEERLAARSREQLEEWRISTQFEAEEIAGRVQVLIDLYDKINQPEVIWTPDVHRTKELATKHIERLQKMFQEKLLQWFRRDGKDAQICFNYYGGKCPFTEHCHNGLAIEDGIESGMWTVREPHHEMEKERFIEKGWLKEDESS